ncbi:phage portal protein [Nocardiopsis sp. CT-R113]|uniref:Phage portal protein n=1 Tax=Nocardiopsis codii TaxID=3065942 RepID=A0ABU7KDA5_9ACTN|nr:phage portal protein [Nocardiopsis sp. CT-R113]MEE2040187.1 phage portal protein [Nocardiopsis sp. CT-R113]
MSFIVSGGELEHVRDRGGYDLPQALQLGNQWVEFGAIFEAQPQVQTVVSFLARNIAQLTLHAYERRSDTDRRRLTNHPLPKLLDTPLPGRKITRYQLFTHIISNRAIYDDAFVAKIRDPNSGRVIGLLPVPRPWVHPEGGSWIEPAEYVVGGRVRVPAQDMIHFHGFAVDSLWHGTSPLLALRNILLEEYEANRHRQQMWRNGARTSGFIQRPQMKGKDWSDEARERFQREFRDLYTGDGADAGGVPVLEDGMTYVPAGLDPKAAQYIEARKLTREEVAAAYHIPPPLVGILDHATFSNIREQHKQLYQDTLGPWLVDIDESLENQLVPELADPDLVYLEFDIKAKMSGSFEEQAIAASTAAGAPWMTVNEIRAQNNLQELEGGNELVVPLNVTQGGQASPRDSAPPPDLGKARTKTRTLLIKAAPPERTVTRATDELSRFFARQARSLGALLGAAKARGPLTKDSAASVNWDRWETELALVLGQVNLSTAAASARAALEEMGEDPANYDPESTAVWLMDNAAEQARATTDTSRIHVEEALEADDPAEALKAMFATWAASRSVELAARQTQHVAGYTSVKEAERVFGDTGRKTWRTTARNSRATHARMNGQTVPLTGKFSNGGRWPGDSILPARESAKCKCQLSITGVPQIEDDPGGTPDEE